MSRRNIGLALVLVFGAAVIALAIGTPNPGEGRDGEQQLAADEQPFIGLTRGQASALAEVQGRP